ncbi:MAG: hypothetical protein V3V09_08775 [Arenicellales bacterium]
MAKHTKTHDSITGSGSALKKYQAVMVGSNSLGVTIYYEACIWFAYVPGAVGLMLRKVFWPRMFKHCGQGVQFGYGITLRHPNRISLGNNVIISEGCILDARNLNVEEAITLGDEVMLANAVCLSAKGGTISIGARTGLGTQTIVQSTHDCPTTLGEDGIIGPQCYLVGGGSYHMDQLDIPIRDQGIKPDSGCHLRDNVWLGGQVSVLGDVVMKAGSVAAAGAVVTKNVDENTIVGGVPAKLIRQR